MTFGGRICAQILRKCEILRNFLDSAVDSAIFGVRFCAQILRKREILRKFLDSAVDSAPRICDFLA